MYYEAGTVLKTHPHVLYDDGVRRIFLYVNGEFSKEDNKDEQTLKNLLRYINESTQANVTDDNTRKLDDIVSHTKARKDIGIKYMKSWERERELKKEGREDLLVELVCKKLRKGMPVSRIAEELEEKETRIQAIVNIAMEYAPDYDVEEITRKALEIS